MCWRGPAQGPEGERESAAQQLQQGLRYSSLRELGENPDLRRFASGRTCRAAQRCWHAGHGGHPRRSRAVTLLTFAFAHITGRACALSRAGAPSMTERPVNGDRSIHDHIHAEMLDSFDEELELEIDDDRLDALTNEFSGHTVRETVDRRVYFKELFRLQGELVKLQSWVQHQKLKVVVIFEGRDSAGKGGVIKRITQRLNPRVCRVAALPAPNERERTQWYFQRYASHLPAGGEIVLFDRSWYNRAGVERVMGFCTEADVEEFFRSVPEFERMLVRSGIVLIKYWFSITDEEQHLRFTMRIHDPLKQWKLSPMDVEARSRWEQYTKAKEAMLERTHIAEAPWHVVEAVDKKKARLNCIAHLLEQIPYNEIAHDPVQLPPRVRNPDYHRGPVPPEMYVPARY
jgi:polyphosphate kinase